MKRFAELPIAGSILELSPDERAVVCGPWGSERLNIRLFEASSGKEIRVVRKGRKPWFFAQAFSRDGRVLVCADYDRSIYAFDVQSGEVMFKVGGFGSRVYHIAVSPENHWIAAAGNAGGLSDDFAIRLVDMTTGKEQLHMDPGRPSRALTFSDNARLLVAVSRPSAVEEKRAYIHVWDVASGRQFRVMEVDTTSCDTVAITRNNAMIAFGGGDGSVRIHEVASGAERIRFTGSRNAIGSVTISRTGDWSRRRAPTPRSLFGTCSTKPLRAESGANDRATGASLAALAAPTPRWLINRSAALLLRRRKRACPFSASN